MNKDLSNLHLLTVLMEAVQKFDSVFLVKQPLHLGFLLWNWISKVAF